MIVNPTSRYIRQLSCALVASFDNPDRLKHVYHVCSFVFLLHVLLLHCDCDCDFDYDCFCRYISICGYFLWFDFVTVLYVII